MSEENERKIEKSIPLKLNLYCNESILFRMFFQLRERKRGKVRVHDDNFLYFFFFLFSSFFFLAFSFQFLLSKKGKEIKSKNLPFLVNEVSLTSSN